MPTPPHDPDDPPPPLCKGYIPRPRSGPDTWKRRPGVFTTTTDEEKAAAAARKKAYNRWYQRVTKKHSTSMAARGLTRVSVHVWLPAWAIEELDQRCGGKGTDTSTHTGRHGRSGYMAALLFQALGLPLQSPPRRIRRYDGLDQRVARIDQDAILPSRKVLVAAWLRGMTTVDIARFMRGAKIRPPDGAPRWTRRTVVEELHRIADEQFVAVS